MNALAPPCQPLIEQALADARAWCKGHLTHERPARLHAVRVAVTVCRYEPAAAPAVFAAALLHDSPEFAPPGTNRSARYGPEVARIVAALHAEDPALDGPDPQATVSDPDVALVSTADKIVALKSLAYRARASGDINAFLAERPALVNLLPCLRAFHHAGRGRVPVCMSAEFDTVLDRFEHATTAIRSTTTFRTPTGARR